jgi:hypothetical protein
MASATGVVRAARRAPDLFQHGKREGDQRPARRWRRIGENPCAAPIARQRAATDRLIVFQVRHGQRAGAGATSGYLGRDFAAVEKVASLACQRFQRVGHGGRVVNFTLAQHLARIPAAFEQGPDGIGCQVDRGDDFQNMRL